MRSSPAVAALLACLVSAGCTFSSGMEDLVPRPSMEVTSSIRPETPRPTAEVATETVMDMAADEISAADVAADGTLTAAVAAKPVAPVEAIALVAPESPAKAAKAIGKLTVHRHRFRDAHPINFGKSSPRKLAVHGVDVSRWQGDIDWPKLRSQGANFAYIKATDGGDHLDPLFRKNWRAAHDAGLKRGAYHFFYWCRTAGEQADWFIRNVPKVAGALPPVLDVEYNGESRCKRRLSRATIIEKMKVFLDKLEAHYGQRPIIYTAPDFYRDNLEGEFLDHPFWLRSVAAHPKKVYPGRKWVFWQYSGSGLSHGVEGKIDLNVFHGDEADWRKWVARHAS